MTKAETAEKLFAEGANCAQAVVGAFAEECGLELNAAFKIASGFGAGVGRSREVCGAVSGMVMVLNMLYGSEDISDKNAKDAHYDLIQQALNKFKSECGSIVCRVLLGLAPGENTGPVSGARTPGYYRKRPCSGMVALAAEITAGIIEAKKNPGC